MKVVKSVWWRRLATVSLGVWCLIACAEPLPEPHETYLGHWKRMNIEYLVEDGYPSSMIMPSGPQPGPDLYIDADTISVVPNLEGQEPSEYQYWLQNVDEANHTFDSCAVFSEKEECYKTAFSADRTEFKRTVPLDRKDLDAVEGQIFMHITYVWINGQTTPNGKDHITKTAVTAGLSEQQKNYVGHWSGGRENIHLYVDPSSAWLVRENSAPEWVPYTVTNVDAEGDGFRQCIETEGRDICSWVRISEDGSEMTNQSYSTATSVGMTQRFQRVDDRITPF